MELGPYRTTSALEVEAKAEPGPVLGGSGGPYLPPKIEA